MRSKLLLTGVSVAILLGGVLAFSDAAISREWVALRAGVEVDIRRGCHRGRRDG